MDKKDVLIIEDNAGLREQLKWALIDTYNVYEAENCNQALELFETHGITVVCLDMGLENIPDKGLELLDKILERNRYTKAIVMTANTSDTIGPNSIKKGAFDFLQKPVDIDNLKLLIERAFRVYNLENLSSKTVSEPTLASDSNIFMVGHSPAMKRVFEFIKRLAHTDVSVFITGESGTGKELCARAIHYHSNRKNKNFVPINCGAIPENLIESELFGYVKGAFTGANSDKPGLLEVAHEGTVLLDEIGEMPKNLQVRLLRFLEDQQVKRLGDTELRKVDVRVIAATNHKTVSDNEGRGLRSDLYFRLSEFQIDLPPLRERGDDILLIAHSIIERNRSRFNLPKLDLSTRSENMLLHYAWPGNIRELENKLSRAAITCVNQLIEPEDLQLGAASVDGLTLKDARDVFEKEFITNVLRRAKYNISEAAKVAGVSRPTLYDLMKKHSIHLTTEARISNEIPS